MTSVQSLTRSSRRSRGSELVGIVKSSGSMR